MSNIELSNKQYVKSLLVELADSVKIDISERVKQDRPDNMPHLIRNSMFDYLKQDFPYGKDWIHPVTYTRYRHSTMETALKLLREVNPQAYKILWAMWTSRKGSKILADGFFFSPTTLKRHCEKAIDILALLLFFPDLHIELLEISKL